MTRTQPNWDSVILMIESLRKAQEPLREELRQIVSRSTELLSPLAEPLLVESPLTKILANSREEVYSEWLAWSLEQIANPRTALRVLGIETPQVPITPTAKVNTQCEYPVLSGHPGSSGRLDIRVFFGELPAVDIEVKCVSAEHADTVKQEGYALWAAPHKVLVAPSGKQGAYEGDFKLLTWTDLCFALRHEAACMANQSNDQGNVLRAGSMLMFVAAVEEILVKVPGPLLRAICNLDERRVLARAEEELVYLKSWLGSQGVKNG